MVETITEKLHRRFGEKKIRLRIGDPVTPKEDYPHPAPHYVERVQHITADFKAWRTRLGLKQVEAAEALGISRNHLSDLERQVKKPSETLVKLAYLVEILLED